MRKLIAQIMKFGVVGIIAFLIDFGILVLLKELLGFDPVIAAGISYVISTVFNYLASMRFVFAGRSDISRQREFVIFVVLSLIGLGINEVLMWAGTHLFTINYMIVKVGATAVVMVWNFCSRKKWLEDSPQKEG